MLGLLITPSGLAVTRDVVTLEEMQACVDGDIEFVALQTIHGPVAMYLNADGKFKNLPVNPFGTMLGLLCGGTAPEDRVLGNILLMGPADADGRDTAIGLHSVAAIVDAVNCLLVWKHDEKAS